MSRAQLYRKVKALTGDSVGNIINEIRLEEGRRLLKTTDYNVSEVAFRVGFKDPAYFSRLFSKKFGVPPSSML